MEFQQQFLDVSLNEWGVRAGGILEKEEAELETGRIALGEGCR